MLLYALSRADPNPLSLLSLSLCRSVVWTVTLCPWMVRVEKIKETLTDCIARRCDFIDALCTGPSM